MNLVWLNGALLPADQARIDPADRGFTLGDGVFETIRVADGRPGHLPRHLARLREGAAVLGISVEPDDEALAAALIAVAAGQSCALRLTLTRGPMRRGLQPSRPARPTILITAGALHGPLPAARVLISRLTCRNEQSPLARIKSLNYLDNIIARQEAEAAGFDDAILLNTRGMLAEASAASLFLRIGHQWLTPTVADGALPGIARSLLLEAGLAVEASLSVDNLAQADAGFLINSLGTRALACVRVGQQAGQERMFFFEEKNQKTFTI